ncbi:MAG: ABC transporter substrate-binding protein [Candidatus Roizmanbacteria bacterium]|nr:ABC transporter substrate-binding protein [Candidatus Roizmanbacteria bacterium]
MNDKGIVLPLLATTWEHSNDEKTYTFTIRRNVLLNNGKVFNAHNVSFSFRDVEMKVVDDYTIRFILQKPLAIFPLYLTKPVIVYPYVGVAGLYSVEKVKIKNNLIQEVVLSPNRKDVEPITYTFFPTEGEMITAYKRAKINEMSITNRTLANAFKSWSNSTVTKNVNYDKLLTLFYNTNNPIIKEKDFRNAVESSIIYENFQDVGELVSSPIPPISWAYNSSLKKRETDVEFAKKTFKRMVTATDSAKFTFLTYYEYLDMADTISSNLRDAGLPIDVTFASYSTQPEFDFMLAYLNIPQDPDQYYYWHSTQSLAKLIGYKNLKVDKLLETGRSTYKIADRKVSYVDMQKTLSDDPPALFLFYPYSYTVKRK